MFKFDAKIRKKTNFRAITSIYLGSMIKDHIISLIKEKLEYVPTPSQDKLIQALAGFLTHAPRQQILVVKGFAGTGKTTVLSSFINILPGLKLRSVLLAPTGRAAKLLSLASGNPAYTIHKKIYRQKSAKDGFGDFTLDRNLHSQTFFIVDEASMINTGSADQSIFGTGNLLEDLLSYVFNNKGCKLILIGDTAQLPPVGTDISPALDSKTLESYGFDVHEKLLDDVVRHNLDSGILNNATTIRNYFHEGFEGFPRLNDNFDDFIRLPGSQLGEEISECYDKFGMDQTIIICRSNKRANKYNQGIRQSILFREEEISPGDYLMVVKNNYYWLAEEENPDFIANGDIIRVQKILGYEERYGIRFAEIIAELIDYKDMEVEIKIILDTLLLEGPAFTSGQNKDLFYSVLEDYQDIPARKKQYEAVRMDPYFNGLQVKFAYAVTCHKAQGGQWKAVFIDQGILREEMIDREYLRWLYTAVTRATERLYLVNFSPKFFGEE